MAETISAMGITRPTTATPVATAWVVLKPKEVLESRRLDF
jgi:hypothetical protein